MTARRVSPSATRFTYVMAYRGSMPLEQSASRLMVPVGAMVVLVAFRIGGS